MSELTYKQYKQAIRTPEKQIAELERKLAEAEASAAAMREALQGAVALPWKQDQETLDQAISKQKSAVLNALLPTAGKALLERLAMAEASAAVMTAGIKSLAHLFYTHPNLWTDKAAVALSHRPGKVLIDRLERAERERDSLSESEKILSDIAAFGNCECDIPGGKTCLVCKASAVATKLREFGINP